MTQPFKPSPFLPAGLTPDQQAAAMKMDGEIRHIIPGLHRTINAGRFSVNAILAALAIVQSEVIKHCPIERREELFNATQFVLRDTVFGVHSMIMPIAPLVAKPGDNGKPT